MNNLHRPLAALFVLILGIPVLAGCAQTTPTDPATPDSQSLYETSAVLVTQSFQLTLVAFQNETATPEPTATNTAQPTQIPTIIRTRTAEATPTYILDCNRVGAGVPFDITIPDESPMLPGQKFTKIWKLINNGSCKWTRLYKLVFFSGNSMEAIQTQLFLGEVLPAGEVEMGVEMVAPMEPGYYQSNWMLQAPDGELFGLGPNGDAPFWARIQVVEQFTPTVVATLTATPTLAPTLTPTPSMTGTP